MMAPSCVVVWCTRDIRSLKNGCLFCLFLLVVSYVEFLKMPRKMDTTERRRRRESTRASIGCQPSCFLFFFGYRELETENTKF